MSEWHADHINDQYFLIDQTTNSLFAGLAVSIAAVIENRMGLLCKEQRISLDEKADWRAKRKGLEGALGSVTLDKLTGFDLANRARLLGNCFKHTGGKTNGEWVKRFGGIKGEEIRYAEEDWDAIIDGACQFLFALVKALPPT